jgi:hypothetical protein
MIIDHWRTIRRDDIELFGVEALLPFLGPITDMPADGTPT